MKTNAFWPLIAGLAAGILIGQYVPRHGQAPPGKEADSASAPAAANAAPTAIPADLLSLEKEMKATDKLAGLTTAQQFAVLKLMNDRPCDCGCSHGSTGKCLAEDPGCPSAPKVLDQAIALAKQGKTADQMMALLKKAPSPSRPAEGTPQKVELAAWTPVKGPKDAKVTIVEFSDFQ